MSSVEVSFVVWHWNIRSSLAHKNSDWLVSWSPLILFTQPFVYFFTCVLCTSRLVGSSVRVYPNMTSRQGPFWKCWRRFDMFPVRIAPNDRYNHPRKLLETNIDGFPDSEAPSINYQWIIGVPPDGCFSPSKPRFRWGISQLTPWMVKSGDAMAAMASGPVDLAPWHLDHVWFDLEEMIVWLQDVVYLL